MIKIKKYNSKGNITLLYKLVIIKHMPNMLKWILTTRCPSCGKYLRFPKIRLQNTAYEREWSNYDLSCIDCYQEYEEYWAERWNDYYSSCL